MATPEFWQNISSRKHSPVRPASPPASGNARYQTARGSIVGWMFLDAVTVLLAVTAATIIDFHISPVRGARGFLHNQLIQGETIGMLSCLLVGFIAVLILLNRGLQLYTPIRLTTTFTNSGSACRPASSPRCCSWARSISFTRTWCRAASSCSPLRWSRLRSRCAADFSVRSCIAALSRA